ncbi:hypothetical protein BTVI_32264 [Pitangus sulphuratus]|nr:hypothetical protein BTVI_32264 [Pitangus sulphuratus]
MDDYDIRSAASILASVKEQEARFERLTRALEEERRNVSLQLERASQPADRVSICNIGNGQPLATAWQQLVLQALDGKNMDRSEWEYEHQCQHQLRFELLHQKLGTAFQKGFIC